MEKKSNVKSWIVISICFLVLIASISTYISSRNNPSSSKQNITLTNVGFDTPVSFQATCTKDEFDQYTKIVKKTFKKYNKLFDQYNEYQGINNVYTLNHKAKDDYIEVDEELINCINYAKEVYDISHQFDITQGALLSLWHDAREESLTLNDVGKDGILPNNEDIQEAMKHTGFDKIDIREHSIKYLDEYLQIDLGGIGKGYATQKCKEALNKAGLQNGFINAGGNVVLLGEKKDSWKIGIQNPDDNTSIVRYTTKDEKAIVTSGDYQRYFTIGDTRYSHIIDPQTGYPATYCRSVTVIMDDSTYADGLSTALFNMSYEDGIQLVTSLQEKFDIGVLWILDTNQNIQTDIENDQYTIKFTENLKDKIDLSN